MADELVFYSNPMSRGRIARWMLEEVGAPYRTEWLTYEVSMKAPDYLAVNPMGTAADRARTRSLTTRDDEGTLPTSQLYDKRQQQIRMTVGRIGG